MFFRSRCRCSPPPAGLPVLIAPRAALSILEPRSGDYVLAVTDTGGVTFKRLIQDGGQTFLRMRPLNPVYTVQRVPDLKTYGVLRRLVVTRDFKR